jgi:hypothetical protein
MKMKFSLSFILVFFLVFNLASAEEISKEQMEAKAVMNQVYESFLKIVPFIYSDKLIFDHSKRSSSEEELIKDLTEISNAFKGAKHVNFLRSPGFKPSLDTINIHIQETIDSLHSKNKVFAHARLKAMTALCISCHSQLSTAVSRNAFIQAASNMERERFDSDFGYANYLYLVRRFPDSVKYFELTMKNSILKNQNTQASSLTDDKVINGDLYTSLRRVLSIYTKITPEPQKAIVFLKKYSNDKSISKMTRIDIGSWIQALEKWTHYDFNKMPSINDFIAKNLASLESSELSKAKIHSGENDITLLISSGVLSKYLNDNPQTDVTPEILYWLAVAERRLSSTYFFSLSDIYLKECIVQFSSSPYAKKCYQEYEDNILFGYSGSAGTDIPVEEKRELDRLKKIIK